MPQKELFMNAKNNASTETVQSAIIFSIRYFTATARILIKHMAIFS